MEIPEIKKLLSEITPWPWETSIGHDGAGYVGVSPIGELEHVKVKKGNLKGPLPATANAEFIAKAPAIIEQLLNRIEELELEKKYFVDGKSKPDFAEWE